MTPKRLLVWRSSSKPWQTSTLHDAKLALHEDTSDSNVESDDTETDDEKNAEGCNDIGAKERICSSSDDDSITSSNSSSGKVVAAASATATEDTVATRTAKANGHNDGQRPAGRL